MMSKLIFFQGCMNSGKSSMILRLIHEYSEQNKVVLTIKPLLSARNSQIKITDRMGESYPADIIEKSDSFSGNTKSPFALDVIDHIKSLSHLDLVVADEAQFLQPAHIIQLRSIINKYFPKTPIMLFGLLKDFQNHLFPTSKWLVENANDIREIKSICWYCNNKATCNLRINNGKPIKTGELVQIGGNDNYKPVCQYHYDHPEVIKWYQ